MKNIINSLLVIFIYSSSLLAQNQGDNIFNTEVLHEIRFNFSQLNYWTTLTNNYENNSDPFDPVPYLLGDVTIDGELVDSVGVRFKGFTSYPYDQNKKPIKIDFNEFVPGKRFDGLRKLNLNNGTGDPGLHRDVICYDLLNANGVAASRTSFAKVYFNDEYWGLYQVIEQIDKEFLQRNFEDDDGNLFKNKAWSHFEWLGNNDFNYNNVFELKTNRTENDWSGFINLMDVLNNSSDEEFPEAIQEVFNVDLFLKTLAVDVATNNWDSYLEHGRNWYIYEDLSTGMFHWIPWDYNFALSGGGFGGPGGDDCELFPFHVAYTDGTTKIEFFDLSFIPNDDAEYLWDFGDGMTSTEKEPVHEYTSSGSYEVCLTLTTGPDCSESFCEFVSTNKNFDACNAFNQTNFDHTNRRTLAIMFNFNTPCCAFWSNECEEEYDLFSSEGGGGFNFSIDQRMNQGVLIRRLLAVPEFYDKHLAYFCTLLQEHYNPEYYNELIDRNKNLIEDAVREDPNLLASFESFEQDLSENGIKAVIKNRVEELKSEIDELYECDGISSIHNFNKDQVLKISPNPVKDILQVELLEDLSTKTLNLGIYNASGKLIHEASVHNGSYEIDVSQLNQGFYFLRLGSENGLNLPYKFIKID